MATAGTRLRAWLLGLAIAAAAPAAAQTDAELVELTAADLAAAIAAGRVSAVRATEVFLARIEALDDAGPLLGAVVEVNPDALEIARSLDRRRQTGGVVGPLHGVPVLLKANIDTADELATSAGSLALAEHHASADAPLVRRLRAAGAVIIGKANLSEWANFRSPRSISGWSSVGGQTRNPYVLDRNPCGSSSGSAVAVAARLVPLAVGTETDGSIVCPAGVNGVVGLKPTSGLVAQAGIVPIAPSQDTAGPIARTVRDAALLLGAMVDPELGRPAPSYMPARASLEGVRIGVRRDYSGAGVPAVEPVYAEALARLRAAGAELVEPVEPAFDQDVRAAELEILLVEFREHIGRYLATVERGPRTLDALIEYNDAHAREVLPLFGQELFLQAREHGGLDAPAYRAALATAAEFRGAVERLFAEQNLDALVAPSNGRAWPIAAPPGGFVSSSMLAAVSGYPSITVPGALAAELPIGITFVGKPRQEAELLEIAAAFERARGGFPAPRFLPSASE